MFRDAHLTFPFDFVLFAQKIRGVLLGIFFHGLAFAEILFFKGCHNLLDDLIVFGMLKNPFQLAVGTRKSPTNWR